MTLRIEKVLSLVLLVVFAFAMVGFAYYTDLFFASNGQERKVASLENNQVSSGILPSLSKGDLRRLTISNRLGTFNLLKLNDIWLLEEVDEYGSTRRLPLRSNTIQQVLAFVKQIEVIREIPYNDINYKTYSFNAPLFQIQFTTEDNHTVDLKLGVNNSLDNSHYFFSDFPSKKIWKTKPAINNLANINHEDLVDPKIIDLKEENITEIQIERETKHKNYTLSKLTRKDGQWFNSKNQEIEKSRLVEALQYLKEIKSSLVINEYNFRGELEEHRGENPPLLTLTIKTKSEQSYIYKVHGLRKNIPNLNLKKRKNLVVESSLHNTMFVINRQSMQIFENLKEARLRKLDLKKIFY